MYYGIFGVNSYENIMLKNDLTTYSVVWTLSGNILYFSCFVFIIIIVIVIVNKSHEKIPANNELI